MSTSTSTSTSTTATATTPTVDKASIIASAYSALSADLSSPASSASTTIHFTDEHGSTWAITAAVKQNPEAPTPNPETDRPPSTGPTVMTITAYYGPDGAASTYTTTVLPRCTGGSTAGVVGSMGKWWNAGTGDEAGEPVALLLAGAVLSGVVVWVALRAVWKGVVGLRGVVVPRARARGRAGDGDAAAAAAIAGGDEKEREEEEEREERSEDEKGDGRRV